MSSTRGILWRAALATGALALASACSGGSTPQVDAGGAATSTAARPSGSTAAPGSTALDVPGSSAPGETTTTAAVADGSTTVVADPGAPTTTAKPGTPTTAPAGPNVTLPTVPPSTGPGVTNPPTTQKATTTTVAKPTLNAGPPPGPDALKLHCMGGATTTQAQIDWTTQNATQVAVQMGQLSNAFSGTPLNNPNANVASGSYTVFGIACNQQYPTAYTTVTARGPGGDTTVVITWTLHFG